MEDIRTAIQSFQKKYSIMLEGKRLLAVFPAGDKDNVQRCLMYCHDPLEESTEKKISIIKLNGTEPGECLIDTEVGEIYYKELDTIDKHCNRIIDLYDKMEGFLFLSDLNSIQKDILLDYMGELSNLTYYFNNIEPSLADSLWYWYKRFKNDEDLDMSIEDFVSDDPFESTEDPFGSNDSFGCTGGLGGMSYTTVSGFDLGMDMRGLSDIEFIAELMYKLEQNWDKSPYEILYFMSKNRVYEYILQEKTKSHINIEKAAKLVKKKYKELNK